jgi:hypothetical protein
MGALALASGTAVTTAAALDAINDSLRLAVAERNRCLRAWIHSANHHTHDALKRAQAELDLKLEQRYAVQ